MNISDLLKRSGEWLKGQGPNSHIVISSRIRLARNVGKYSFPLTMEPEDACTLFDDLCNASTKSTFLRELYFFDLAEIEEIERNLLLERHLVSQDFIEAPTGRAFFLRKDEVCSIMVNEEDHLRIQIIKSGFDLANAWELASKVDDEFSKNIDFAFSPELGYLTSCPTNVGTGMRASCMLHLPALIMTKRINHILDLISKLSFTTRGFFGEGTQAVGNFFQVSNQVTLGVSEEELIGNLTGVIKQLMSQEIEARGYLLSKHRMTLEDKVWRAVGILKNSRLMTSSEALGHLSLLRLGIDLGIIKNLDDETLNNLLILIQPAHLQSKYRKEMSHADRDMLRAMTLREKLHLYELD